MYILGIYRAHMGQFLQDGENEQNLAFFWKKIKRYGD